MTRPQRSLFNITVRGVRRRVVLTNRTRYRFDDLRVIVRRTLAAYWLNYGPPLSADITVFYRRIKDGFCGGYAYFNSPTIILKVPKDATVRHGSRPSDDAAMNIARTLNHELAHCRGLRHHDMPNDGTYNVEHVRGLPLRERVKRAKRTVDDSTRRQRILVRIARWEMRRRRATTAITKLKRTLTYYDRKLAACSSTTGDASN